MAVPKERLQGRLKAYLTSKAITNLSNTRIDEFSARLCLIPADDADDAAIDSVISSSDAFFPFKDIATSDDRVRTLESQAKKTTEEKSKEQLDAEAKAKAEADAIEAAKKSADQPEWVKALMAKMDATEAKLTALETGKVVETKKASAAELFAKSEVLKGLKDDLKPNWLGRINVDSETPLEDQIASLESEFTTLAQSFADSKGYSGPPPTGTPPKPDDKVVSDVVDSF